jgi:nucleotide-binding universal stress UspA family protein
MNAKTLIPVDGSLTTERTLDKVIGQQRNFPAELTLLHVVDIDKLAYRMIPDFQISMIRDSAGKAARKVLDGCEEKLRQAGFEVDARLEFGPPRQTICRIANEERFEMVVIGRRQSTGEIRDVLFGSVANYVLHNVACPVMLF